MVKHKNWKELKSEVLALYSTSSTDMQMVAQHLPATGALTATDEMFHVPALCSLLSSCKHPFFPSPLSIQMLFHKHKFCIATKCQLNADLEQVKLPFEEGILIPKEALTEELNYSWTVTSSPKPHTQTIHTFPLPELPTTANSHCNHPFDTAHHSPTHVSLALAYKHSSEWQNVCYRLKWLHSSGAQLSCISTQPSVHTHFISLSFTWSTATKAIPKEFLKHTNLSIVCTHSTSKHSPRAKTKVNAFLVLHWILPASGHNLTVKS